MKTIIETKDVWRIYHMDSVAVEAVRGVDLSIGPGEFVAIVGPSGSGKSTLLHMLGAMDRPTKGDILLQGQPLANLNDGQRTGLRARQIGFVFQTFNLLPTLTAFENVEIALRLAGAGRTERQARTAELLERVGLEERAHHLPRNLSGGERRRVAIARALANRPPLLLADEPTGNLDTKTGATILDLLHAVCDESGQTVIMVTHDFRAASYADRVLVLRDGRLKGEIQLSTEPDPRRAMEQLFGLELSEE